MIDRRADGLQEFDARIHEVLADLSRNIEAIGELVDEGMNFPRRTATALRPSARLTA